MSDLSNTWTVVMVSQMFANVQTHQIVHIKYVQLFVYQLNLNKAVFEKEQKQTDKFNLMKITNFCSLKDTVKMMKSHKPGKTICQSYV